MKKTIKTAIIEAHLTEELINTFLVQIFLFSILIGLYLKSWFFFGGTLLIPITIFLLSNRYLWCRILSIILGVFYALLWAVSGALIGWIFSVSASIVLCLIFLIPGVIYNWCAINYFKEQ